MSITACRECGQPVSTEAASCPHCGITAVEAPPMHTRPLFAKTGTRSPARAWAIIAAIAVALPGGYLGWQHFRGGNVDGSQVETTVAQHFHEITNAPIGVDCPTLVSSRKGKITDCTATREDTGKSTAVYVTAIDDSGHYSFQAGDPMALLLPIITP